MRTETGGERQVAATGETVRELLDDLVERFPGLRSQLIEEDEVAPFVNVFVDNEDVRTLAGLETPVRDTSTVILLPAMAGGSQPDDRRIAARQSPDESQAARRHQADNGHRQTHPPSLTVT